MYQWKKKKIVKNQGWGWGGGGLEHPPLLFKVRLQITLRAMSVIHP